MMRVLLAGLSTRAFAESAHRAGYEVIAVDGFSDLDLAACARDIVPARDAAGAFSASRAARRARPLAADAVSYVAGFENHPDAVRVLARSRPLWGNPPPVLRRVRDPIQLVRTLSRRGLPVPMVRGTRPPPRPRPSAVRPARWLVKPRASGGGHGIVAWRPGRSARPQRDSYFQERIAGVAGSLVFAADGKRAVALGFSRLLVGDARFGGAGFRYCGNIVSGAGDPQFADEAALSTRSIELGTVLAEAFGLVGVNGVDFVARGGVPYAVEVNPRYTASMELVERLYGLSIFEIHRRACAGELPEFDLGRARAGRREAIGKAIVYACDDSMVGDTRAWLDDPTVRDVPRPGERIPRGKPICTVFARARTAALCARALAQRAGRVYRSVRA